MRVFTIVHQRDAGPGVFEAVAEERGVQLERWHPAEGEPLPEGVPDAAIVLGGAVNVHDPEPWFAPEKALLRELFGRRVPLLGVCLGAQLVAEAAGGSVRRASEPEIGWHPVTAEAGDDPILAGLAPGFEAFQWHSYEAVPPPGAVLLAHSPTCVQAFRLEDHAWGIQFHAEVTEAIAAQWTREYRKDPDAAGLDPDALLAQSARRISAWNELGRGICARFLEVARGG